MRKTYKFVVEVYTDVYESNDGFKFEFESTRKNMTIKELVKKVTDHDPSFDMRNPNHSCFYWVI